MATDKLTAGILCNEIKDDHLPWIRACEVYADRVDYRLIDFTGSDWLREVRDSNSDLLLAKPPGISSAFKQLYDERIHILSGIGAAIYPTPQEIFIYENKRYLYSWLKANSLPHPETTIIYDKSEAVNFVRKASLPLVAKTNIGASGSGVKVLKTEREVLHYIRRAFSDKGVPRRWGPDTGKGDWLKRATNYIINPKQATSKINIYKARRNERQKDFVIFQQYIPHDYEWRVVVIGDSFFAHKKVARNQKASGSLLKEYGTPPLELIDFAYEITKAHGFFSQSIDLFEVEPGGYLINEMQCIFGQSDQYQMKIGDAIGRYVRVNNQWSFQEGDFNRNQSYNLRLEEIIRRHA